MSTIITEKDIAGGLRGSEQYWVYNGLDCCITEEVRGVLASRVNADPAVRRTYNFELSCQAPAMAMMLRGTAFDENACTKAIREWEVEERRAVEHARSEIGDLWDKKEPRKGKCFIDKKPHRWSDRKNRAKDAPPPEGKPHCEKCNIDRFTASGFNPLASPQVIKLLYGILKLPTQHSRKGARGVTADDEALEKLKHMEKTSERDAGIIRSILDCRKARKQIGFLKSRRSCDGRLRQSVNVGATETGRWSASKDPFREGTNFQNIADRSRNVLVADPGLWLFYADLEQAESKIVAYDAEDQGYVDAHNAGDVHTVVAKMVWPELPWPDDNGKLDREVADGKTPWDPEHSFRDYAKHVQHGGNIGQTPFGMARDAHIPLKQAQDVYERMYGQAFPGVRRRQKEIMAQVASTGILVTPLGRKRQFFGRLWEPATQREGMAQTQQSSIADLINLALWRIWIELDTGVNVLNAPRLGDPNRVWLLAQIHDAILGLIRPHDIETLGRIKELMTIPTQIRGQTCTVGVDIALGKNFRHFNPKKPETVGGISSWHVENGRVEIHNTKHHLKKQEATECAIQGSVL